MRARAPEGCHYSGRGFGRVLNQEKRNIVDGLWFGLVLECEGDEQLARAFVLEALPEWCVTPA